MNRRAIIKGALGGVLGLTLPPLARSAFSQESQAVVPVSEGFVMLTGAGGNILVKTASTGQVLVDSGAAESTDAVLKRLRGLPGAGRVTNLFNTHWHREQVGGNLAFGKSGAKMLPLLKDGAASLREALAESDLTGSTVGGEDAKNAAKTADASKP